MRSLRLIDILAFGTHMSESTPPAPAAAAAVRDASEAVDVGSSSEFPEGKGRQVSVGGRQVGIFRYQGTLYALDHHCYHAGGPLAMGDIEELVLEDKDDDRSKNSPSTSNNQEDGNNNHRSHPCVVCPWHNYKISLTTTGEGLYVQSDPFSSSNSSSKKQGKVKSRGRKQRCHVVYEETKNGRVMVQLNLAEDIKLESDYYASEDFQLLMQRKQR